jgi:hypothetical protein
MQTSKTFSAFMAEKIYLGAKGTWIINTSKGY